MALTNLTFGDGTNKALLCSFRSFMRALVSQLHSPSEDLRQVGVWVWVCLCVCGCGWVWVGVAIVLHTQFYIINLNVAVSI